VSDPKSTEGPECHLFVVSCFISERLIARSIQVNDKIAGYQRYELVKKLPTFKEPSLSPSSWSYRRFRDHPCFHHQDMISEPDDRDTDAL
jgi:hypothetical protein